MTWAQRFISCDMRVGRTYPRILVFGGGLDLRVCGGGFRSIQNHTFDVSGTDTHNIFSK